MLPEFVPLHAPHRLAFTPFGARSKTSRRPRYEMNRAGPDLPDGEVVSEHDMHAEHVAALETTLFRKYRPTLVLALESGRLRVLSKSVDRSDTGDGDSDQDQD